MSALVADTHATIWYLGDPSRLSRLALKAMRQAAREGDPIFVSAISLIEVIYLVEKGRLPEEALNRLTEALESEDSALIVAPLDLAVAQCLRQIPRDRVPDMPDRVIAATALALGLPLITRDQKLGFANVHTVW